MKDLAEAAAFAVMIAAIVLGISHCNRLDREEKWFNKCIQTMPIEKCKP